MAGPSEADLQEALGGVRAILEEVVRREQHRNDLTQLPNERALDQYLASAIEKGEDFWCALVEVDHFKRLNRRYTYDAADGMLRAIGQKLGGAENTFPGRATAFHAHGDEFYLCGRAPVARESEVQRGLDALRASIAVTQVVVDGHADPMQVTVTIGWVHSAQLTEVQPRSVKGHAEDAVALGKRRGRDRVVVFDPTTPPGSMVEDRDVCASCGASFTVDVDLSHLKVEQTFWHCPNCGCSCPRDLDSATIA